MCLCGRGDSSFVLKFGIARVLIIEIEGMFGPSCLQASYKSAHLRTEDILSDQIV